MKKILLLLTALVAMGTIVAPQVQAQDMQKLEQLERELEQMERAVERQAQNSGNNEQLSMSNERLRITTLLICFGAGHNHNGAMTVEGLSIYGKLDRAPFSKQEVKGKN
jgi:TolA-binding protein